MSQLEDKVAVITGASSGIGRATALAWARAGAHLVVAARNVSLLDAVAGEIRALGQSCLVVPCDVSQEEQVARLAAETERSFGRTDILFNCAGVSGHGAVDSMPLEVWDQTLAVNLRGTFLCCRAFLPGMKMRRSGVILNVASAERGYACKAAYNCSKVAVVTLTQALAEEVRPYDISVNAVRFGVVVDTKLARAVNPEVTDRSAWQRPEDVTDVLTFLAAQRGTYVTGGYINIREWQTQVRGPLTRAPTPPPGWS